MYDIISEWLGILLFCQNGETALICAVNSLLGKPETVSALVQAGADVNLQDKVSEPN